MRRWLLAVGLPLAFWLFCIAVALTRGFILIGLGVLFFTALLGNIGWNMGRK